MLGVALLVISLFIQLRTPFGALYSITHYHWFRFGSEVVGGALYTPIILWVVTHGLVSYRLIGEGGRATKHGVLRGLMVRYLVGIVVMALYSWMVTR